MTIEEMINVLVRIAWDAGDSGETYFFDDEYNQISDKLFNKIKRLEARCKELEAEVANLKCCGNCKSFHHCQFLISDTDVIVRPPENFDCDKWEGKG